MGAARTLEVGISIVPYADSIAGSRELVLDVVLFDSDRAGAAVLERVRRDVEGKMSSDWAADWGV